MRGRLLATAPTTGDYSGRGSDLSMIQAAIIDSRRLRIHHFSAHRGKVLERTVDPYGFWYVDGAIYLIAFDQLRSDYRKFLVDRIREVIPLEEVFEADPAFDMNAYVGYGFRVWHGAIYHAVVEFEPELAHLPHERRFHHTQRLYPLAGGRCRVTFEAAGLPELAAWVASFGGMVRAVEPPELVEMVRDKHREGLRAHGEPVDSDVR
jgi:predicted DNA-binding transcriptional regulator YafY